MKPAIVAAQLLLFAFLFLACEAKRKERTESEEEMRNDDRPDLSSQMDRKLMDRMNKMKDKHNPTEWREVAKDLGGEYTPYQLAYYAKSYGCTAMPRRYLAALKYDRDLKEDWVYDNSDVLHDATKAVAKAASKAKTATTNAAKKGMKATQEKFKKATSSAMPMMKNLKTSMTNMKGMLGRKGKKKTDKGSGEKAEE